MSLKTLPPSGDDGDVIGSHHCQVVDVSLVTFPPSGDDGDVIGSHHRQVVDVSSVTFPPSGDGGDVIGSHHRQVVDVSSVTFPPSGDGGYEISAVWRRWLRNFCGLVTVALSRLGSHRRQTVDAMVKALHRLVAVATIIHRLAATTLIHRLAAVATKTCCLDGFCHRGVLRDLRLVMVVSLFDQTSARRFTACAATPRVIEMTLTMENKARKSLRR